MIQAAEPSRAERLKMIQTQVVARGVQDPHVLKALSEIPREDFLPAEQAPYAYEDRALAIDCGQTISQPYIVALMTEMLQVSPGHRVLEIGTGTGYQTAVLARLAAEVFTVERIPALSYAVSRRLATLGITNVSYRIGDGSLGWPRFAPFDRILVTAAAPSVPPALRLQLGEEGRLVLPVGEIDDQRLVTLIHTPEGIVERAGIAVRFVKLIGEAGFSG